MTSTSIRIASVIYDAARSSWLAVVEFLAPGVPGRLAVPVRLWGPQGIEHDRLVRALVREAKARGVRP